MRKKVITPFTAQFETANEYELITDGTISNKITKEKFSINKDGSKHVTIKVGVINGDKTEEKLQKSNKD